ncbi:type II and III secretion system protein family protein [Marinobacterium sp. D7]|uniref:type II and III secretion system protein family protein n=1 Tax=Marinobacterium ramblicola TaxID=2849041 RepID=UPI001C2D4C6F|nr:type II and III secretion system protein family protein [Marinobacterium ramblicola]MBV1786949.1 type II and III secretion system protein family protein [Marinobacterium ramblicola]
MAKHTEPKRAAAQAREFWQELLLPVTILMLLMAILVSREVNAATAVETDADTMVQHFSVPLYKSKVVQLSGPVHKVSIGNEEVADILVMRSQQIYVLGKGIGTTNVLLWDKNNHLTASIDVEVTPDINSLKAKLYEMAPNERIKVNSSQGSILLSGEVTNVGTMDMAVRLADSFLQKPSEEGATQLGEVVNLLKVGGSQQVMLKVTVAEMSRSVMKRLGVKFHALDTSDDRWLVGGSSEPGSLSYSIDNNQLTTEIGNTPLEFAAKGLFAQYLDGGLLFQLAFDAAKENGSAKVLAEPTLTTLTGQEAEFLSGGEFPIPVPNEDGITIEFKEFGVGLKFIPVVLDSGTINLSLNVSVTELTGLNSVNNTVNDSTFFVPALTKRSARSTVELGDGQTIGIAGLINESTRDAVSKFPGLGDVPVLGHLFRSQSFEKGESELVILVTPTLAKPFKNEGLKLPGDGFVEPSDVEFYLLGRTQGRIAQQDSMMAEDPDSAGAAADETEEAIVAGQPGEISGDDGARVFPVADGSESVFGHSIE